MKVVKTDRRAASDSVRALSRNLSSKPIALLCRECKCHFLGVGSKCKDELSFRIVVFIYLCRACLFSR